jgi:hypothetical protein
LRSFLALWDATQVFLDPQSLLVKATPRRMWNRCADGLEKAIVRTATRQTPPWSLEAAGWVSAAIPGSRPSGGLHAVQLTLKRKA